MAGNTQRVLNEGQSKTTQKSVGIHEELRLNLEESGKAGLLFCGLRRAARVSTRMAQGKIPGAATGFSDVCTTCARHTETLALHDAISGSTLGQLLESPRYHAGFENRTARREAKG